MTKTERYAEWANRGMVEVLGVTPETVERIMACGGDGTESLDQLLVGWLVINRAFGVQIVKKAPSFDASMARWLRVLDEVGAGLGAGTDTQIQTWNPRDFDRTHTN